MTNRFCTLWPRPHLSDWSAVQPNRLLGVAVVCGIVGGLVGFVLAGLAHPGAHVTVRNDSSQPVESVLLVDRAGTRRLGPLEPGESEGIYLMRDGRYSLRATFADDSEVFAENRRARSRHRAIVLDDRIANEDLMSFP